MYINLLSVSLVLWFCSSICIVFLFFFFFFNDTATTEIYTFPYTTLFRSRAAGDPAAVGHPEGGDRRPARVGPRARGDGELNRSLRSEEHTSELQSLAYLVCRLLLEKKKKKNTSLQ